MDPMKLREMNIVKRRTGHACIFTVRQNTSCALDRCIAKVKEMSHWDENYPVRELGHGKVRALGMGLAMQGSCISGLDVGSAALKLNDEGFYIMRIAAADMGTGCDTILAQIAAEVLECPLDKSNCILEQIRMHHHMIQDLYASSTTLCNRKGN